MGKSEGECFDFIKGKCSRGDACRFTHIVEASSKTTQRVGILGDKKPASKTTQRVVILGNKKPASKTTQRVVILGDKTPSSAPEKKKKPKHLKRKAEAAELVTDLKEKTKLLKEVAKDTEELKKFKQTSAIKWKNYCRKHVTEKLGAEKEWDEQRFNDLVASGIPKDEFLKVCYILIFLYSYILIFYNSIILHVVASFTSLSFHSLSLSVVTLRRLSRVMVVAIAAVIARGN